MELSTRIIYPVAALE